MENKITTAKNLLCIWYEDGDNLPEDLQYLLSHFCGEVLENPTAIDTSSSEKRIYACGDLSKFIHQEEQ
ncbi:MAG: hypothetical protein AAF901_06365 [Bacteroidota bacterium]